MRKHRVVYLVGVPGAGKTTVLRDLAMPPDHLIYDNDIRWTLKAPYAFVGAYTGLALDGGDQVARHANILTLEYWARNILPNPQYHTTFLDGEMFLWARILETFQRGDLKFADATLDRDKNYREGGLRWDCWEKLLNGDESRFPLLGGEKGDELGWTRSTEPVQVHLSCAYLTIPDELSLSRRKAREEAAGAGETKNDDRHMKTAASKQRNFSAKFRPDDSAFFMEPDPNAPPYLEIAAEDLAPDEIRDKIFAWLAETRP
jgi:hypothetical protein